MRLAKVGIVSSSYPRSNNDFAGIAVRSLAEHLGELGHEVHVLVARDPDVEYGKATSPVRMHYFPYAWSRRLHVVGYGRSLESDVKLKRLALAMIPTYFTSAVLHLVALGLREKLDILHAHWVIPTGPIAAIASRILRIPLVVSLHGSDVYVLEGNRLYRSFARISAALAKVVTACSDDLRVRMVAAGVPDEKVLFVPIGVDVRRFHRDQMDDRLVSSTRQSMLGTDGEHLILAIGRLVQKKGFDHLIRAISCISSQVPGVRLVIVGDGDERSRLQHLADECNAVQQVVFTGAISWDLIPYYLAACDIVAVPSVRDTWGNVDGLPNVLLEAMASAKPVVASAIAGIPAVVRDGVDGYLVREKSPLELADALEKCLTSSSLRERLGHSARQRVLESFSWPSVARRMSAIYEEVIRT